MKYRSKQPNATGQSDCPYSAGEKIPHSGVYEICHDSEPRTEVILTVNGVFPFCKVCGDKVRYKLLRAVPHISEDPDFNEWITESHNQLEDSTAAKQVLPRQLGLSYGFRFWQDDMQAWRESPDGGDL